MCWGNENLSEESVNMSPRLLYLHQTPWPYLSSYLPDSAPIITLTSDGLSFAQVEYLAHFWADLAQIFTHVFYSIINNVYRDYAQ